MKVLKFDFTFARVTRLRESRPATSIQQEILSRPPPPTLLTTLLPSVPREAPPQLAPLLDVLISSSP
ncbi:hypothetical protein Tco_0269584 [Tanacetum coccineum]